MYDGYAALNIRSSAANITFNSEMVVLILFKRYLERESTL